MLYDYIVIGGGIVGLATAMQIAERRPGAGILLLEKEDGLARHQTGHNSGVIHAGIYYAPGSFKAELCRRGAAATKAFCAAHGIPFEVCGKTIVATDAAEQARMDALYERATANGVALERLDAAELKRREPRISGVAALFAPTTGIVDYRHVCAAMGDDFASAGGTVRLGATVTAITEGPEAVEVVAGGVAYRARRLVACAGLQSDRLARLAGLKIAHRIVPFRGEYYRLAPHLNDVVKTLIYPVPDPTLPFLGIHLTRMIDGSVTVGPNAVLGMAREGYAKFSLDVRDLADTLGFPGFWRTLIRHPGASVKELGNSLFPRGYLAACRKYCPDLALDDLKPHRAGIRAQAVMPDGTLVHDFLFVETPRMLHVCNAPSPAATSALPIGAMIADKVA
ncbi:L-2-hydroxyglutarate oxidase [Aquabacter spiritensis]|uniref:L-2-hydroxyglutarate oxidase n=1 Tax=Aquabacter spiritensis TaxID=933073 RepID=A0A4R3LWW1_9HYPH|nr:L-2-hydroxyglutarate oxidase [Aquabacter spiritensis]TCT03165.1 L-2-hydroxyglutarate oxidase [Aquabacter spiritensis]